MIKLIVGHKGSGKTKTMITMANEAAHTSNGNVVCVEKGIQLTYDLDHQVRLVDAEQYGVTCYETYCGFLCGLMAGNYDITHIYCDAVTRICGKDLVALEKMLTTLSNMVAVNGTEIIMNLSLEPSELPESVKGMAI